MEGRHLSFRTASTVLCILLYSINHAAAFSTSFPLLSQCEPATVTWNGADATPPFQLAIVPIGSTEPTIIQIPNTVETWDVGSKNGSYTFDPLDLPGGTPYIASMSDGNGHGFGGVSVVRAVSSSSNSNCLPSGSSEKPKIFKTSMTPSQCLNLQISWDSSSSELESTVRVRGFVPGGTAFFLDPPPAGANETSWTVNVQRGTQFVLLYSTGGQAGTDTLVETSELFTVQGNDASPTNCFIASNPSSTVASNLPSTTTSRSASSNGVTETSGVKVGSGASKSGGSQAAPIAGGVIGGIAGTLLIVGLVLFLSRRRRRPSRSSVHLDSPNVPDGPPDIQPRPYLYQNTHSFIVEGQPSSQMQESVSAFTTSTPLSLADTKGRQLSTNTPTSTRSNQRSDRSSIDHTEVAEEYIRAQDAGPVESGPMVARSRVVELPPLYQDVAAGNQRSPDDESAQPGPQQMQGMDFLIAPRKHNSK